MFLVRRTTPKYTVGVQILVQRPDGRILLVRQTYRALPFLPGGVLRRGERVLEGARRELREETGLDVEPVELGRAQVRPQAAWVTFYALAAVDEDTAEAARPRSAEIAGLLWAWPGELPEVDPGVRAALNHVLAPLAQFAPTTVSGRSQQSVVAPPGPAQSG
jgi:ADP-ribose pyrophosphatase YjhB (NUDIX family)